MEIGKFEVFTEDSLAKPRVQLKCSMSTVHQRNGKPAKITLSELGSWSKILNQHFWLAPIEKLNWLKVKTWGWSSSAVD